MPVRVDREKHIILTEQTAGAKVETVSASVPILQTIGELLGLKERDADEGGTHEQA